ncbi:MAG: S8 family serine peptidase [Burkholderiales bacterium]|nr:S8 family serine peptidase [Burkholderiales bacterium]
MKYYQVIAGSCMATLLSACGGGDSDTSTSTTTTVAAPTYSLATPSKLTAAPTVGTPSFPITVSNYGVGTIAFDSVFDFGYTSPATATGSLAIFPTTHLTDTGAALAWASGWTGKGVNITVIDDFYMKHIDTSQSFSGISRSKTYTDSVGSFTGFYNVKVTLSGTDSHGDLVSNISGGDYDAQAKTWVTTPTYDAADSLVRCDVQSFTNSVSRPSCPGSYLFGFSNLPAASATVSYAKVAGVAKESLVTDDNVDLSSSQNAYKTITDIQGHLINAKMGGIINLSLGSEINTTGQTFAEVMAVVAETPVIKKMDSVVVVAAGNGGAPCATDDLSGCNAIAVAMAFQEATKDSTIVAGALSGAGSNENIAIYSTRAGILANRFLLAQGTAGYPDVVGTSFAAPRIAGAAAIVKQKFPQLTSKQIADVLLLSANKDINNSGTPSFTGVHPVYGHGKLDLQRALSLAGAL